MCSDQRFDVSNKSCARAPGVSLNESSNGDCPGLNSKAFASPQTTVPGYPYSTSFGGLRHELPRRYLRHLHWLGPLSDAKLDLCLFVPGMTEPKSSVLDNTPEQIKPWMEALRTRFGSARIALCLEQPAGGLLSHLLGYDFVVLYARNPMSLARHRETLVPSRAKSDASGAYYLPGSTHA